MLRRTLLALALCGAAFPVFAQGPVDENILVIDVTGSVEGRVEIELLPQIAPLHVERIKTLAREGAYDDVAFHRVISGFMAQTGDVKYGKREMMAGGRAGFGGSELPDVAQEFSDEGFVEGIVGMARGQDVDSANSQFFIMLDEGAFLNGKYTVFGRVLSGMEVVHGIQKGERAQNGSVATPDFMSRVVVKSDVPAEKPAPSDG